jgi:hypothetical protein
MIKSKFKLQSFIFPTAIISILFFGGIGTIIYPFTDEFNNIYNKGAIVFIGVFLLVLAAIVFIPAIRSFYIIEITDDLISIKWIHKSKSIHANDIVFIQLFSLWGSVWSNNPVSVLIKLDEEKQDFEDKDEAVISLPDGLYKNMLEIIEGLEKKFGSCIGQQNKATEFIRVEEDEVFRGNPYTSFAFIIGILAILLMTGIYFTINKNDKWFLFLTFFVTFFWTFISLIELFYFEISDNKIIIKNHFLFWYRKEFLFRDIELIDFFYPGRRSQALRIVTSNRKVRFYCGGSLRDKTWQQLKERLIAIGIPFEK